LAAVSQCRAGPEFAIMHKKKKNNKKELVVACLKFQT
jgi:hypothetical protein